MKAGTIVCIALCLVSLMEVVNSSERGVRLSSPSVMPARPVCLQSLNGLLPPAGGAESGDKLLDQELLWLQTKFFPDVEEKAIRIWNADRSGRGPIRYWDSIDSSIRKKPEIASALMRLALRRLPYLQDTDFNIFLSGRVGLAWKNELVRLRAKEGLNFSLVLLPGGLSKAVNFWKRQILRQEVPPEEVPEFPEDLIARLQISPSIFLDDTLSSGATEALILDAIQSAGGNLDGSFIAYLAGSRDRASLYKTGKTNYVERYASVDRRSPKPSRSLNGFRLARPLRLGVEMPVGIYDSTFIKGPGQNFTLPPMHFFRQYVRLLGALNEMQIPVQLLRNGRPMEGNLLAGWAGYLRSSFPALKILAAGDSIHLAMGNWGNHFYGNRTGKELPRVAEVLEVVEIAVRYRNEDGSAPFEEDAVDENYYLNRLVDMGVLIPIFEDDRPRKTVNYSPKDYDLRR